MVNHIVILENRIADTLMECALTMETLPMIFQLKKQILILILKEDNIFQKNSQLTMALLFLCLLIRERTILLIQKQFLLL